MANQLHKRLEITGVIDAQNYLVAGKGVEALQNGERLVVLGKDQAPAKKILVVTMLCGDYVLASPYGETGGTASSAPTAAAILVGDGVARESEVDG